MLTITLGDNFRCAIEAGCGEEYLQQWYHDAESRVDALLGQSPQHILELFPGCDDRTKTVLFRRMLLSQDNPDLFPFLVTELPLKMVQWLFRQQVALAKFVVLSSCTPERAAEIIGAAYKDEARDWFDTTMTKITYEDKQSVLKTALSVVAALPERPSGSSAANTVNSAPGPGASLHSQNEETKFVPQDPPLELSIRTQLRRSRPGQLQASSSSHPAQILPNTTQSHTVSHPSSSSTSSTRVMADDVDGDVLEYIPTHSRKSKIAINTSNHITGRPSNTNSQPRSTQQTFARIPPAKKTRVEQRPHVVSAQIPDKPFHTADSSSSTMADDLTVKDPRTIHPVRLPWMARAREEAAGGAAEYQAILEKEQKVWEESPEAIKYAMSPLHSGRGFDPEVKLYFVAALNTCPSANDEQKMKSEWSKQWVECQG